MAFSERDNTDCHPYMTHCNTIIILHLDYINQDEEYSSKLRASQIAGLEYGMER